MAELHPNQIQYKANRTAKANLVQPQKDSWVANAFIELGALADKTAGTIAAYDDNKLKSDLSKSATVFDEKINNAKSLDANYDELGAEAMADWDMILQSAPESARRRFLMNNPNAKEEYQIVVQAKVLDKHQKQVFNRSKLDIAQWSSQVVNAPAEYQDAVLNEKRRAIQNLGLSIEQTDELLFDLQKEVDSYQIASYINNNKFEDAKNALKNGLPTVGAAQRAMYWGQLKSAWESEQKRIVEEEKARQAAVASGNSTEVAQILSKHAAKLQADDPNGAKKLREDWYYGRPIQVTTESGKTVYVDPSIIDASVRQKLYETMAEDAKSAPVNQKKSDEYAMDYYRLQGSLVGEDGHIDWADKDTMKKIADPELITLANRLFQDEERFSKLDQNQRNIIRKVLYEKQDFVDSVSVNPNATYSYGDLATDNPIVAYANVLANYSTSAFHLAAQHGNVRGVDRSYSGIAPQAIYLITKEFKDKYVGTPYEIREGTRADLVVNTVAQIAMKGNRLAKLSVGITDSEVDKVVGAMFWKLSSLKQEGLYDTKGTYDLLYDDVKEIIKVATGRDIPNTVVEDENGNQLSPYNAILTISVDAGTGDYAQSKNPLFDMPTSDYEEEYGPNGILYPEGIRIPKTAHSIKYLEEKERARARQQERLHSEGFESYGIVENPIEAKELEKAKRMSLYGLKPVQYDVHETKMMTKNGKRTLVRQTVPFSGVRIPGEQPDFTKTNYEF